MLITQPKDSSFTNINDKEKHQIFTYKKLQPANVWHFCLRNDWKYSINGLSVYLGISVPQHFISLCHLNSSITKFEGSNKIFVIFVILMSWWQLYIYFNNWLIVILKQKCQTSDGSGSSNVKTCSFSQGYIQVNWIFLDFGPLTKQTKAIFRHQCVLCVRMMFICHSFLMFNSPNK